MVAPRWVLGSCVALAALASGGPARGDLIHLHNGRALEGRVLEERPGELVLAVPGGTLTVPRASVARVEARPLAEDELALRLARTDARDPEAVRRLADWASARGLGERARDLHALADGVDLEGRVAAAEGATAADAWLDLLAWAEARELSREVRGWLAQRAVEVEPDRLEAQDALARLGAEARAAEAHADPGRRPGAARRPARLTPAELAERARLDALEAELAQRREEADALRARLDALEQAPPPRRTVILRRRRPPPPPLVGDGAMPLVGPPAGQGPAAGPRRPPAPGGHPGGPPRPPVVGVAGPPRR